MKCKNCSAELPESGVCPICFLSDGGGSTVPDRSDVLAASGLAMNWYKFLSYFGLWVYGAANIIGGILLLTGTFTLLAPQAYETFSSLRGADIFIGIVYIALGIFSFAAAIGLLQLKKEAPVMAVSVFAADLAVTVIYTILCSVIADASLFGASIIFRAVAAAAAAGATMLYFSKRGGIFTN